MANPQLEVRRLQVEIAKLRDENTQLRKRLGENSRHAKRVQKAYEDALLMVFWRSMGIQPSRRFCARYDINQHRFENALGLLRMARIVRDRSRWVDIDPASAESRLAAARDRATNEPGVFFLRLNRHHQR
jgi:hypothetical protein